MRNLKRALSLALASVMLLGMMVIGTSAASFTDADEIVNTEAVEITAGLGLFAGSEGKFNPKGTVTRAQMATIIVKMLYGSEINADSFKGVDKFSDTAAFEGGWAEGYINLCANLGVVGGYGDGTFRPGQAVTTAEAVTMIINALGVDAGEGTWPLTVMAAAETIKLFEDLTPKPGTNVALTRDELAVVVLNGLNYSPEGKTGYVVNGQTYDEYLEAYLAANAVSPAYSITTATKDSLATKVFGLKTAEGFVDANASTGAEATVIGGVYYDVETGLDMIGRYVTVYFKDEYVDENDPGVAYAVVDESKVVVVAKAIDNRADYRSAFGVKAIPQVQVSSADAVRYYVDYAVASGTKTISGYNEGTYTAPTGTYVIYDGAIVAYRQPSTVYASKVTKVDTTAGKEYIKIAGILSNLENNETEDEVVEYDGIAKDDYIYYTYAGSQVILNKMVTVEGKVTSINKNSNTGRYIMTVGGKGYEFFGGNAGAVSGSLNVTMNEGIVNAFNFANEYTLYLTNNGGLIGYTAKAGQVDVSNVVYVQNVYQVVKNDDYGTKTAYTYAQAIDMEGNETNTLINMVKGVTVSGDTITGGTDVLSDTSEVLTVGTSDQGFYTFEKNGEREATKNGIMTAKPVSTTYNKVNAPIFADVNDVTSTDADKLTSKTKYVYTENYGPAYVTANTKFIMIDGTGNQLEVGVTTGSVNHTLVAAEDMLLSKNSSGNVILEAMVISVDPANVLAEDVIYVADSQVTFKSKTDAGYAFEVYNAKTGELMTMVMESGSNLTEGFWTYSYNETEGVYEIEDSVGSAAGAYTDQQLLSLFDGLIATTNIDHYDASKVVVVDSRTESEIETSEIDAITDLADVVYLTSEDEGYTVVMDIFADNEEEEVLVIIITDVTAPVEA